MYSYQSQKVTVPVIIFSAAVLYLRHWLSYGRKIMLLCVISLIMLIPLVQITFSGSGMIRYTGSGAFNTDQLVYQNAQIHYLEAVRSGDIVQRLYFSKKTTDLRIFISNYLSHFSPVWLFRGTMSEPHKVP